MKTKICTKCNIEKLLSEFYIHNTGKFGVNSVCKICDKNLSKNRYQLNNEKRKISIHNYHILNSVKRSKYTKQYYENNKNLINIKNKNTYEKNKWERVKQILEYNKEKYHTDINFKIRENLRNRFREALHNNSKSGSAVKMLGCSIEEFKKYFESLFMEGMTWEKVHNGEIHIDHKRPLASFDLSIPEEQAKACHYTNLQPLWAVDNLKKSDKWEE